jgi:hypothetical protein
VAAEKENGMPFAPFMDNLNTPVTIAKSQIGFYNYVCVPLWTAAAHMLPTCGALLDNLNRNIDEWKKIETEPPAAAACEDDK